MKRLDELAEIIQRAIYVVFVYIWAYYWHHYYAILSWYYSKNPGWWELPAYVHVIVLESWMLISLAALTYCAFRFAESLSGVKKQIGGMI